MTNKDRFVPIVQRIRDCKRDLDKARFEMLREVIGQITANGDIDLHNTQWWKEDNSDDSIELHVPHITFINENDTEDIDGLVTGLTFCEGMGVVARVMAYGENGLNREEINVPLTSISNIEELFDIF